MYSTSRFSLALVLGFLASLALAMPVATSIHVQPRAPQAILPKLAINVQGKEYLLKGKLQETVKYVVWSTSDPSVIATQLPEKASTRDEQFFKLVTDRTINFSKFGSQVAAGDSQINKAGAVLKWRTTPSLHGHRFEDQPGFRAVKGKGEECTKFLGKVRMAYQREMFAFHEKTNGQVNIRSDRDHTMWASSAEAITGFLDYESLETVQGAYNSNVKHLLIANRPPAIGDIAFALGLAYYPNSLCAA